MEYLLISFSHKSTNIVDRDSISFKNDEKLKLFMDRAKFYLTEIMILNTCNRVEFFVTTPNVEESIRNLYKDISQYSEIDVENIGKISETYRKESAIHHLFSVVSSLESLVIGETQIVGQIKDAFRFAFKYGFAGQKISRAIHYGFKCSALVRQNTAISKHKVSIASVAVSKAETVIENLDGVESIVIGSGEMSRLISQYLQSKGSKVTLINRTQEKADKIAKEIGGIEVQNYSEIYNLINSKPLLFTATSSEKSIITKEFVKDVEFQRYWFDLAVPKDIDDCRLASIKIFRIDDLQDEVNNNIAERREEIIASHKIIGESTMKFFLWINSLSVEPLIKNIYLKAKDSVNDEVSKAIFKGHIPEEFKDNVEKIAQQSINKLLHGMSKNLKKVSNSSSSDMIIESINYLFNLNSEKKKEVRDSYKCDYTISEKDNLIGMN